MTVELRTTRHFAAALTAGCTLATLLGQGVAHGQQVGPFERITGASPFSGCTADNVAGQDDPAAGIVNYPNTEIEPWIDANPTNPLNLIAGWQQDRWSDGGGRGNPAAVSRDGGATWRIVTLPRASKCTGGVYLRNSDPWLSFSPNGTAYYMTLAFDPDPPGQFGRNAMLVNRSTNGGRTWSNPIALIRDPDGQALNDKNSLTADSTNSRYVYAVWDRLVDFTLDPPNGKAAVAAGSAAVKATARGADGAVAARQRVQQLRRLAAKSTEKQPTEVFFKGPAYLARTTNGGQSWERARNIYDPGPNAQTIANQVVVLPNGTVIDFFTEISPNGGTRIGLLRSLDKGASFRRPSYAATIATVNGVVTPDTQELVRDASILFDVAVDRRNGNLYLVWQDVRFSGVDEVAFAMSTDAGRSWSAPVRINKTPRNANELRRQVFVPSIEVGPGGRLVVTYYDFRFDRDDGREATDHWAVFCNPRQTNCRRQASWDSERRLTPNSFNLLNAPVARGYFLGDYMGLVASRDGVVHSVFGQATRNDVTNLYTRAIRFPQRVAQTP